jgi:hypothetical protein
MPRTLVPAQQRRALRRSVVVDCQVVRESDFALVASRGVDLSPTGMLVRAERPALTGEPLVVSFRLPSSSWWFDAQAILARVVHGRRPGDCGRCFGISFETLDPAVQFFLHTALQGVAPPFPRRELRIDYARTIRRAALS